MADHASTRGGPARDGCATGLALPPDCKTETLGVAFFDLSRMAEWGSSEEDIRVAGFLTSFYARSAQHLGPAGGRIVKFMGDAGLVVFPKEAVERGIFALAALAEETRALGQDYGFDTYLNINVHYGPVVTGSFGAPNCERYDVIGKTVNIAARLGRRGLTLSAQAFRCLSAEGRERFDKVTSPATYRYRW